METLHQRTKWRGGLIDHVVGIARKHVLLGCNPDKLFDHPVKNVNTISWSPTYSVPHLFEGLGIHNVNLGLAPAYPDRNVSVAFTNGEMGCYTGEHRTQTIDIAMKQSQASSSTGLQLI